MKRRVVSAYEVAVLLAVTVVPLVAGGRGRLNADTKQYLYLDPAQLMERARNLWDPAVGGGSVTHQTIGYLWPMGPFYWLCEQVGLPDWVAQRVWVGLIQFAAGLGALVLMRALMARTRLQLAGALVYALSPFVFGHVVGQSALLLPFSALPWLVLCVLRAVEQPGWRWPARFALIVTSVGSLNGSSVFFALGSACLWIPYAIYGERAISLRQGAATLARLGSLTLATQLWWLIAYAVGGKYGIPLLSLTETVQATNGTTSAAELMRGLGYWFFYGGDTQQPWLAGLAPPYLGSRLLLVATFSLPVLAIAAATRVRFRGSYYFAAAMALALIVAVGAFPEPQRSPYGRLFEAASRRSDLVLSLRNTQRAAPMIALSVAVFLSAALALIERRHARVGLGSAAALAVLAAGALPAQWRTGLIGPRFHREDIPQYWLDAAAELNTRDGRILELPGIDFASYRWGHTLDPITPGLVDRPVIARELIPLGTAPGISLFNALDRSLQEGWFEPSMLAPVARLLGATDVVVRSDLEYERYRTARPALTWAAIKQADLADPQFFGPRLPNVASPRAPLLDELTLGTPPLEVPAEVTVLRVPRADSSRLQVRPVAGLTVIDGDGEGVLAAAAAGLLDGDGITLYGASVAGDPSLLTPGARLIVTDTNRKQAGRWYALRDNVGATEPATTGVVLDDVSDGRVPIVDDMPISSRTVIEWEGAQRIWATVYGGPFTLTPEERPSNAFDGDARTAWRADTIGYRPPWRIGIELGRDVEAKQITLRNPTDRPGTNNVTRVRITLDGARVSEHTLEPDPVGAAQVVALDGRAFHSLELEILDATSLDGSAGFAEIEIPGVSVREFVVTPTVLSKEAPSGAPLAFVLSRQRANPAEPVRADPEPALARIIELGTPQRLALSGTARLNPGADDALLDQLLGARSPDVRAVRGTEHLPGALATRASAALDANPATAWSTPLVGISTQRWTAELNKPITLASLDLTLVNDNLHSSLRSLTLQVDDQQVELAVPTEPPGSAGSTQRVSIPLPRAFSGRTVSITLGDYVPRRTPDWYSGDELDLPVAIAEVSLPGIAPVRESARTVECRSDLLTIDEQPVPIRIVDERVESCSTPLQLSAGRHTIVAASGFSTGFNLDRLVLAGDATAAVPTATASAAVSGTSATSAQGTVTTDGSPFWLVLDQSFSEGWKATVGNAKVKGPFPINSFANGWLVEPTAPGELAVAIDWIPQNTVDLALYFSLAAAIACLALALLARGRRAQPSALVTLDTYEVPGWRTVALAGVAFALFVHPLAGPVAAAVFAAARHSRQAASVLRYAPAVLVAVGSVTVVYFQNRDHYAARGDWPRHFGFSHVAVMCGVLALGLRKWPAPGPDPQKSSNKSLDASGPRVIP